MTGCCCCVCCPLFFCVGQYMSRNKKMNEVRCVEMTSRLAPYGIRVTYEDSVGEFLIFSRWCRAIAGPWRSMEHGIAEKWKQQEVTLTGRTNSSGSERTLVGRRNGGTPALS